MRLVINEEVCEGCGDCVKQANCMSLTPVMTELGQKIRIHQSSCNKDYTCALGDCPSFVTVNIKPGTGLKKKSLPKLPDAEVPLPRGMVKAGEGYRIIGPGIGGTGVVTINALLATAAWIDGLSRRHARSNRQRAKGRRRGVAPARERAAHRSARQSERG